MGKGGGVAITGEDKNIKIWGRGVWIYKENEWGGHSTRDPAV